MGQCLPHNSHLPWQTSQDKSHVVLPNPPVFIAAPIGQCLPHNSNLWWQIWQGKNHVVLGAKVTWLWRVGNLDVLWLCVGCDRYIALRAMASPPRQHAWI
jgi:hypothetical protein